ncbi:hypothetical protein H311_02067, partial [Anncaliia algerae PRA109]
MFSRADLDTIYFLINEFLRASVTNPINIIGIFNKPVLKFSNKLPVVILYHFKYFEQLVLQHLQHNPSEKLIRGVAFMLLPQKMDLNSLFRRLYSLMYVIISGFVILIISF